MVLGVLSEGERHGYELLKDLEERGLLRWAPASKVAVYKCLARMEAEGSLTSWTQREGSAPEKRVYAITAAGENRLREMIYAAVSRHQPLRFESLAALPFLTRLEKEDAVEALENRLSYIEGQGRRLNNQVEMLEGLRDDISLEALRYESAAYTREARFLRSLIDKLGPGQKKDGYGYSR
jgi:DNA-binding PadR family transcriptional regulator